ncbi:MAG: LacI family DNA-binding transcriptional regulator [Verrucomicrobia bacterium]|nr:LacI family DNA-binding transcriptional regulator [Verrucomicrobiota bacterium]
MKGLNLQDLKKMNEENQNGTEQAKRRAGRPRRDQAGQVNQQILAERLNLSQTTVSRALAHHASINAETKAMVWDLAAQLGYSLSTPTKIKSKRGSGDNMVVGVIISIPKKHRGRTETSQIILRGIAERSTHHRVTIDILYHEPAEDETKQYCAELAKSLERLYHGLPNDR